MANYICIVEEIKNGFSIYYPDFGNVIEVCDSYENSLLKAKENLVSLIGELLVNKLDIPEPRSIEDIEETYNKGVNFVGFKIIEVTSMDFEVKKENYFDKKLKTYNEYLAKFISGEDMSQFRERANLFLIDRENLSDEVETQGALYSYIANMCAVATQNRNKAKIDEKVVRANVRIVLKREGCDIPKPTVDDLSALAESDPEVLQAVADTIHTERILDHLEADREACRQKGDMLRLLAVDMRREIMLKERM